MKIYCPRCDYEGRGTELVGMLFRLIAWALCASLLYTSQPLPAILLLILTSNRRPRCPACGWRNPLPLASYQRQTHQDGGR